MQPSIIGEDVELLGRRAFELLFELEQNGGLAASPTAKESNGAEERIGNDGLSNGLGQGSVRLEEIEIGRLIANKLQSLTRGW